jgi:hypothetical protein
MTYEGQVLALTRHFAKLSISPESSDGFASVGTILPKEEAALLPGGLFALAMGTKVGGGARKDGARGGTLCVAADREGVGRAVSSRRGGDYSGWSFGDYRICRVAGGTLPCCGQRRSR